MTKTQLRKIASELKVAEYADYRKWLRALYNKSKEVDPSYSFAKLSLDLGLSSTNAHTIINGKRGLTEKTAERVASALNLSGVNKKCLELFVRIERAKSSADREKSLKELIDLTGRSLANDKSRKQFEFYKNWYNAAILELLRIPDSKDDLDWIANTLNPKVSLPRVKQSIELLKELGYIAVRDGRLRPTEQTISSGDEVKSMAAMSFHHQMIGLAKEALDKVPAKEREISSLTLAAPSSMKAEIKAEIVKLRKKLLQIAENTDEELEEIVQVNFQLFGLGKVSGDNT